MNEYSEVTKQKIRLYFAANYLFDRGKSHPQVVEILSQYDGNNELLVSVVDAAMVDHWRKIFNDTQRLISEGKIYQEVFDHAKSMENDEEIIHFICNTWYRVQTLYIENVIESRTNLWDGTKWLGICSIGLVAAVYLNFSLVAKIIWGLGLFAALITWLYGLQQKNLAKGLKKILEEDYTKFEKLI